MTLVQFFKKGFNKAKSVAIKIRKEAGSSKHLRRDTCAHKHTSRDISRGQLLGHVIHGLCHQIIRAKLATSVA